MTVDVWFWRSTSSGIIIIYDVDHDIKQPT